MIKVSDKKSMCFSKSSSMENHLVHFFECQLATVDYYAMLKKKTKHEFKRQIEIAQRMFDVLHYKEVEVYSGHEALKIQEDFNGSVEAYAKDLEEEWK